MRRKSYVSPYTSKPWERIIERMTDAYIRNNVRKCGKPLTPENIEKARASTARKRAEKARSCCAVCLAKLGLRTSVAARVLRIGYYYADIAIKNANQMKETTQSEDKEPAQDQGRETTLHEGEVRYYRDPRIEQGCISDRTDIAAPATYKDDEPAEQFEDLMIECGFDLDATDSARKIFDRVFNRAVYRLTSDAMREVMLRIADTKTGKTPEFRALLAIMSPGRTLQDVADEAGLSKQTVHYHLQKLKEAFPDFRTQPPLVYNEDIIFQREEVGRVAC